MITLLRRIFLDNWQRKLLSIILAVILWFMVSQSLISTKTFTNIPVRVINIPHGKTVIDLQNDSILANRVSLTLSGNKTFLDELSASDLEVILDAQNRKADWIASINQRNLISINPEFDLRKNVFRVSPASMNIRYTKLVTEKIPIFITQPIGEAPRDYQFLDIWPYQLSLTISGPEEAVKRLRSKGIRLTFNLNDISKAELDALQSKHDSRGDEVSFFVPDQWKRVPIPSLSETPIEIDDPRAKDLRIDFVRASLLPINSQLPIGLYFPTEFLSVINPKSISVATTSLIEKTKGLNLFSGPLFAKGVSHLFLRVVEQMLQLTITVEPIKENQFLHWSITFVNPRLLEDRYVSLMMSDVSDEEVRDLQPLVREEYLRNRFRTYMNRFQLYRSDDKRLDLHVRLENEKIYINEGNSPLTNSSAIMRKTE